jgi:hypothetical protein
MLVQDYVDTVRPFESSFEAMSHTFLISASGKDDLGGGKLVEITMSEKDLKLSFEARTTPAQTGTVTTGSSAPVVGEISFIDTGATFIANGVTRGSLVINFTDQSVADVVEVISETELMTKTLVNGIGNTFDVADVYHIFNVEQMTVQGGNVVAVDNMAATTNAIQPTAFTQVVLTLASSGTVTNLTQIETQVAQIETQVAQIHGQARRGVFLNTEALVNGNGYQQTPFDNWSDAVDSAEALGLQTIYVEADATVDRNISNFRIIGTNLPTIDLGGFDYKNGIFNELTLTGDQGTGDSPLLALTCAVLSMTNFNGSMLTVTVQGTISIADGAFCLINGVLPAVGGVPWTLDMGAGGAASTAQIQNISGGMIITNMDNAGDSAHFAFSQGAITIDASCTAGNIVISGDVKVTDNSGAGCTVDVSATTAYLGWEQATADHQTVGTFGEFVARRLLTLAKFFSLRT